MSDCNALAQGTETLDAYGGLLDEFLSAHEGAAVPEGEAAAPHGIAYRSTADIARSGTGPDAAAAAKTIEQVDIGCCMCNHRKWAPAAAEAPASCTA